MNQAPNYVDPRDLPQEIERLRQQQDKPPVPPQIPKRGVRSQPRVNPRQYQPSPQYDDNRYQQPVYEQPQEDPRRWAAKQTEKIKQQIQQKQQIDFEDEEYIKIKTILNAVWLNTVIGMGVILITGMVLLVTLIEEVILQYTFVLVWLLFMAVSYFVVHNKLSPKNY